MMKRAPDNVRYLGQFGEDILTRSFTARDPKETSVGHWTRSNIARFEGFNAIAKADLTGTTG
jgi:hypothetical protein